MKYGVVERSVSPLNSSSLGLKKLKTHGSDNADMSNKTMS